MIFSELYSAYYNTVAKIMEAAFNPEATEKDLQRCVTTIWYLSSARPAKRMLCVPFASSWRPTLRLTQRCPCWRNGFRL